MWRIWVTGTPAGAGTNMITVETNSLSWLQCGDGDLYVKSSYFRVPSQLVGSFCIASPLNAEEVAEQIVLFRGHCGSSAAIQPSGFLYNAFFPRETETLGSGTLWLSVGLRKHFLRKRHKTDQPPSPPPSTWKICLDLSPVGAKAIILVFQPKVSLPTLLRPWTSMHDRQGKKSAAVFGRSTDMLSCSTSV